MHTSQLGALASTLSMISSRRGLMAALAGGLLAVRSLANGGNDAEARKQRKRRKKRQNRKKTRIVASCPGTGTFGLRGDDGNVRIAQTFAPARSGQLVRADLLISADEGTAGAFFLRLSPVDAAGAPTNDVLAETSLATAGVPDGNTSSSFVFGAPARVGAGITYALTVTRPGGDRFTWHGEVDATCDGQSFFSSDQTTPFDPNLGVNDLTFTALVRS